MADVDDLLRDLAEEAEDAEAEEAVRTMGKQALAPDAASLPAAVIQASPANVIAKAAPSAPPPTTAGSLLDALLPATAAPTGGGDAPQGGAASSGGAGGDPKENVKMLLQAEARLRALEASMYTSAFLPVEAPPITDSQATLKQYFAVAAENPAGHGMGGPGGVSMLSFLKSVISQPLPPSPDEGFLARISVLALLYARMRETPPAQLEATFKHCQLGVLDGNRKGQAIVVFHILGRATLPSSSDLVTMRAAIDMANSTNSFAPLVQLSSSSFTLDMGEAVPTAPPGVALDRVLLSVLCTNGATRSFGRAPPSAQARKLRKGKGKGKGK